MTDPKKPYGPVEYADPGYQDDGRERYLIDTEAHCRAAWSYINQSRNAAKYSPEDLAKIKRRIRQAGRRLGIEFGPEAATATEATAAASAEPSGLLTVPSQAPAARSWYRISNLATGDVEMALYNDIGGMGITAQQMLTDLDGVGDRSITLRMNSRGGDVFDGIAIYEALKRRKGKVTCVVDSLAASIASVIAMAADHVVMARPAKMMAHDAHGSVAGNAADTAKYAELLDQTSDTIAGIYAERTGGSTADWRERMREETWFTAHEAVDAGLADEVQAGDGRTAAVAHSAVKVDDVDMQTHVSPMAWDPEIFRQAMKEATT